MQHPMPQRSPQSSAKSENKRFPFYHLAFSPFEEDLGNSAGPCQNFVRPSSEANRATFLVSFSSMKLKANTLHTRSKLIFVADVGELWGHSKGSMRKKNPSERRWRRHSNKSLARWCGVGIQLMTIEETTTSYLPGTQGYLKKSIC